MGPTPILPPHSLPPTPPTSVSRCTRCLWRGGSTAAPRWVSGDLRALEICGDFGGAPGLRALRSEDTRAVWCACVGPVCSPRGWPAGQSPVCFPGSGRRRGPRFEAAQRAAVLKPVLRPNRGWKPPCSPGRGPQTTPGCGGARPGGWRLFSELLPGPLFSKSS